MDDKIDKSELGEPGDLAALYDALKHFDVAMCEQDNDELSDIFVEQNNIVTYHYVVTDVESLMLDTISTQDSPAVERLIDMFKEKAFTQFKNVYPRAHSYRSSAFLHNVRISYTYEVSYHDATGTDTSDGYSIQLADVECNRDRADKMHIVIEFIKITKCYECHMHMTHKMDCSVGRTQNEQEH